MINLLILTLNCLWLIGMNHVIKNNVPVSKYKLGAEITLAMAAVCGINFLLGIMLLFDLMESTPNDLLRHMMDDKTTMTRMIMFGAFFGIHFVFGARLAWRRLVRQC